MRICRAFSAPRNNDGRPDSSKKSPLRKTAVDAIYSACLVRFRPILMTGLTSIFGAIPLVIGLGIDTSLRRASRTGYTWRPHSRPDIDAFCYAQDCSLSL